MNCDRIAPWYRWLEYLTFGPALQRRRLEYMDEIMHARRVLIVGDGDGRFTAEFLRRNQIAVVDSVDASAGMVRLAERRMEQISRRRERLHLLVADARTVELAGQYDLVISHYFLDCLTTEEVEQLAKRVAEVASPGARWLISEFRVPHGGWRRWAAELLITGLYLAFRMFTGLKTKQLPDYAGALESGGFGLVQRRLGVGGLLVSEMWQRA